MSTAFPECERFIPGSRLRKICEGAPDLSLETVNKYRQRFGLEPLSDGDAPPRAVKATAVPPETTGKKAAVRKPAKHGCRSCGQKKKGTQQRGSLPGLPLEPDGVGPGSQLLAEYRKRGLPECEACLILAAQMDAWGVQGCREYFDEIITDILPRARDYLADYKPWLRKLLTTFRAEDFTLSLALRRDVLRAIDAADAIQSEESKRKGPVYPRRQSVVRKPPSGQTNFRRANRREWLSAFTPGKGIPDFVTVEDLGRDTLSLIKQLPADITHVMGVARSGLLPATMVSLMLHIPLTVIQHHQGTWVPAGNGWRMNEGGPTREGTTVVVDDTVMTGNALKRSKHLLQSFCGKLLYTAIYVNPRAAAKPDLWVRDLSWPHLLEWNLFNSVLLHSFALDFDGVLCHDCPPGDDDDGPRYARFLREVRPLYLVRKTAVELIVTARLERYRQLTERWMCDWGVTAKQLVMGPWATKQERSRADVGAWKAEQLRPFLRGRSGLKPRFFIESDPRQAARIASLTGSLIVCPPARKCFSGGK